MYRYLDQEIVALDSGGRFVVTAIRKWITAVADRTCPADAIAPDFLAHQMIGGLTAFHRALALITVRSRITLAFARSGCPTVAEAEAIVLSLLQAAPSQVETIAGHLLPEYLCAEMRDAVADLNAALHVAGLSCASTVDKNL